MTSITTVRGPLTLGIGSLAIRKEEIVETKLAIPFTKVCNGMSPVISLHIFSSDSSCQQGPGNK